MLFEVDNRCEGRYGHHDARRYNFQYNTVYRTILIRVVSPWLFSSPDRYLRILANVKPIDFFAKNFWPDFVATLERPWSDCTLYVCVDFPVQVHCLLICFWQATVLLAVNLSFLAVPNINPDGAPTSVAQIACLCSIIFSIGCIVIGLLLVNEDHTDPKADGLVVCMHSDAR